MIYKVLAFSAHPLYGHIIFFFHLSLSHKWSLIRWKILICSRLIQQVYTRQKSIKILLSYSAACTVGSNEVYRGAWHTRIRKQHYWCMVCDLCSSAPVEWRVVACAIMDSTRLAVSRNASDSSGRSGRSSVMCADRRLYTELGSFLFLWAQMSVKHAFPTVWSLNVRAAWIVGRSMGWNAQ